MGVLDGKIALITGGSEGIGKCIALTYAKAGANIIVASRKQENLDKVVDEIKGFGREALAIATDVKKPEQVDNMVKKTIDYFRGILAYESGYRSRRKVSRISSGASA